MKILFFTLAIVLLGAGCSQAENQAASVNSNPQTTTIEQTNKSTNTMNTSSAIPVTDFEGYTKTATGLQYKDTSLGEGETATTGKTVTVHYTGMLPDGTKFDSSLDRGQSFEFLLGSGMVIAGWDEGVAGMKVGGKRVLVIPPEIGYGERGAGGVIPPGATLHFEVELLEVE